MLAQNFKTPTDLGISDVEFNAMLKVLGMLERKEIPEEQFDMSQWKHPHCGTAGCIGGWAESIANVEFGQFGQCSRMSNPKLDNLYMADCVPWGHIRTKHAAIALRSYLTHGEARWEEAMRT